MFISETVTFLPCIAHFLREFALRFLTRFNIIKDYLMNPPQLAKYHIALGYEEAGMRYEAIADNLCRAVNQVLIISLITPSTQNIH